LLISLATGLVFGIIPAIKASGTDINEILKVGGRGGVLGWTHNRLRSLLVISEIALALVALVDRGCSSQHADAQQFNPGFESQNLLQLLFDLGALRYDADHGHSFSATLSSAPNRYPASSVLRCPRTACSEAALRAPSFAKANNRPNNRGTLVILTT